MQQTLFFKSGLISTSNLENVRCKHFAFNSNVKILQAISSAGIYMFAKSRMETPKQCVKSIQI